MDSSDELRIRKGATVSSIDDESGGVAVAGGRGGGGTEEGEGILREGERLRRRRERNVWSETMESSCLGTEAGVWINRTVVIGCCFCHWLCTMSFHVCKLPMS